MVAIVTRAGKGSGLTNAEGDANFNNLNSGKVETADKDAVNGFPGLTASFGLKLKNAVGSFTNFLVNATTAARTWTLPDKDGTFAMTSDLISPANLALTGTPTAPTAATDTNSTQLATTAFVKDVTKDWLTKNVVGGATLTAGEAAYSTLNLVGALIANVDVIVPSAQSSWLLINNSSGAYTLTVKTAAGAGVVVGQGKSVYVYCDGTGVYLAQTDILASVRAVDGPGSLIDADTLDGVQGAAFAQVNAAATFTDLTATGHTVLGNATTDTINIGAGGFVKDASGNITTNGSTTVNNYTGFVYHYYASEHLAWTKKVGAAHYYWRKNDTGLIGGANEVDLMTLTDAGKLTTAGGFGGMDGPLTRVMLSDTGYAYYNSAATNALSYVNGSHQRWAPATGAQSLTVTDWPPTGNLGELFIEGVNLGAATITWLSGVNWVKNDGTLTTVFASNGVTLQAAGTDFVLLWTRDAGTTVYGKVMR